MDRRRDRRRDRVYLTTHGSIVRFFRTCILCQNHNFASKTACNRCHTVKALASHPPTGMEEMVSSSGNRGRRCQSEGHPLSCPAETATKVERRCSRLKPSPIG